MGEGGASGHDAGLPGRRKLLVLTDGSCPDAVGAIARASDDVAILPLDEEPRATAAVTEGAVIVARDLGAAAGLLGRTADAQADARLVVTEQPGGMSSPDVLSRFDARAIVFIGSLPVVTLSPATQRPGTAARWVPWLGSPGMVAPPAVAPPAVAPGKPTAAKPAPGAPAGLGARPTAALRVRGESRVRGLVTRPSHLRAAAAILGATLAVLALLAFSSAAAVVYFALVGLLQAGSLAVLVAVLVRSRRAARSTQANERRIDALHEALRRLRQDVTTATGVVATSAVAVRELVRHIEADGAFVVDGSRATRDERHRADAEEGQRRQAERYAELSAQVAASADAVVEQIAEQIAPKTVQQVTHQVTHKVAQQITQLHGSLLNDLQALEQLLARYEPTGPLPAVAGWAMNPTGLVWLADHIERARPPLVVECGSGASTLWMSLALRRTGSGRLVALEHLPEFAEQTRLLLDRHGLSEWAEVRHVPLTTVDTPRGPFSWYDVDPTTLSGIGLLLVDGPPGTSGPHARYPALPVLGGSLRADATIVLDDSERADEREILDMWLAEDDRLRMNARVAPGVDVLRRA